MNVVGKLGAGAAIAAAVAALRTMRGKGEGPAADPTTALAPAPTDAPEPVTAPEPARTQTQERAQPASPAQTADGDRIDLNKADFEQLRSLGLSVTLASRIIATRDEKGGFSTLEELDEVRGLSASARADLRKRFRV